MRKLLQVWACNACVLRRVVAAAGGGTSERRELQKQKQMAAEDKACGMTSNKVSGFWF